MWSGQVEDERLLRALYASHARPLLAFDRDIAQETLLRAWQHAEDLDAERAGPWLFAVTRRPVVDQGRHQPSQPVDLASPTADDRSTTDDLDAAPIACPHVSAFGVLTRSWMCYVVDALRRDLLKLGVLQP
jgi:RNA polymerase sigma-70 factor (ECF subfamily)